MPVAFVGGSVFGPGGILHDADVLVDGTQISAVSRDLRLPDGTRRIMASGKTILPGLIDVHTHLTHGYAEVVGDTEAAQGVRAPRQAIRALRTGITTVRELGSYRGVDIVLRNAIQAGLAVGPRMLCSGPYIAITGGHGYPKGRAADGPDEVRKAVRELVLAGADQIKIMCSGGADRRDESAAAVQFTDSEIRAAIEEATFAGRPVAAHAHPTTSIKWAITAGARSIEHGTFLDEECIELMVATRVFLVPTLAIYRNIATSGLWPDLSERAKQLYEAKIGTLRNALEAGVPFAIGTDTGEQFPIENYHSELELLVTEAGLATRDVLLQATQGNAEFLGLKDVGVVAEGFQADLVVVNGNPVQDLSVLCDVTTTVRDGIVFEWETTPAAITGGPLPHRAIAAG